MGTGGIRLDGGDGVSSHLQIIAELEALVEMQARTVRVLATRLAELGDTVTGRDEIAEWVAKAMQEDRKMYIDADTIIKAASLLGAIGALVAAIVSVYKVIESNKKQSEFINAIQEEQTLICYGLRGALQGLVEQGCNGPCKDALDKLDKHLNKSAHPHIKED